MSLYTVTINLPDHVLGDEWVGINPIGPVIVNGITQGNLSRISMWLIGPNSPTPFKLDSNGTGDALIVIDNAGTWVAHISPVANFLKRTGDWKWDMKFYHSGNVTPITLYQGVLKVVPTTNP